MGIRTITLPQATPLTGVPATGICLVMLLEGLSSSSINVQVAAIRAELAPGAVGLQLVASAFLVSYAALLLPAGRLSDRLDRRTVFRVGVALFGVASLLGALAPDVVTLVIARLLQGAGAALTAPSGFALLTAAVPVGKRRNRLVARYGAFGAVGFSAGLVLPGLLVTAFGWRSGFTVLLPFVIAVVLMTWRLPRSSTGGRAPFGWLGSAALLGVIGLATYMLGAAPTMPTGLLLMLGGGGIMLAAVLMLRRHEALPMVALAQPVLRAAMLALACVFAGVLSSIYLLTLALQDWHGHTAFAVGLLILPQPLLFALTASLGARWVSRAGPMPPLGAGILLIGLAIAAIACAGSGQPHPILVLGAMAGVGTGLGLVYPSASIAAVDSVPESMRASTSALLITAQNVGGSLGLALVTALALVPVPGEPGSLVAPMLVPAGLVLCALPALAAVRKQRSPMGAGTQVAA